MIIFDKKYNEIEKELADRRNAAKHEAERRTLEIYGKFPQIAEIDNTINTLGILIVYCAMKRKAPTKVVSGLPKEYLSFNFLQKPFLFLQENHQTNQKPH